jgi:hypothetical protein
VSVFPESLGNLDGQPEVGVTAIVRIFARSLK